MKQKSGFSGQIGFVFAAAGSAVGVGNLWRFPYLAAKDGGGLFLIIYLVLVLTFGFTLLTTDIAIGRKTGKSAIYAYESMRKKWKFLGILTFLVPVLIMTYYAVIGGWILKYITIYYFLFLITTITVAKDTSNAAEIAPTGISPVFGELEAVSLLFVVFSSCGFGSTIETSN